MSRKVRSGTAKLLRIKLGDDTDRHANIFIEPRVGYRMENGDGAGARGHSQLGALGAGFTPLRFPISYLGIDYLSVFIIFLPCSINLARDRLWKLRRRGSPWTWTPPFRGGSKPSPHSKASVCVGYCQAAIDRELTRDEANGMAGLLSDKPDHELFAELRQEIFGGKPLPGSSADLIREAREIRDAETAGWA